MLMTDWRSLEWVALSDVMDASRKYARLGLHPIALHGCEHEADSVKCTCGEPECVMPIGKPPTGKRKQPVGKHPVERSWQKQTTYSQAAFDRMMRSNWRRNIGLKTGRQPDGRTLVVIDVDGPLDLLEPLIADAGPLPETLTVRTGSGGFHLFFWGKESKVYQSRVKLAPGVDIRGEGGQVVAAPSLHVSGARYEIVRAIEPAELPS